MGLLRKRHVGFEDMRPQYHELREYCRKTKTAFQTSGRRKGEKLGETTKF